jgi:alkanesulfonate monooxygenase SsuD/methylene tetrahydromethanopterin reductase-like flavin-dependent oxidoreductase (luciferase family)
MANVGYTLMTEQAGPKDLMRWATRAEDVGFDLLVSSDHYFPWVVAPGLVQPLVSAMGAPYPKDKAKRAPGRRSVADVRHPVGGVGRTAHPGEGHYREPHN